MELEPESGQSDDSASSKKPRLRAAPAPKPWLAPFTKFTFRDLIFTILHLCVYTVFLRARSEGEKLFGSVHNCVYFAANTLENVGYVFIPSRRISFTFYFLLQPTEA